MNLSAIMLILGLGSFGAGYYTSSLHYSKEIASYETEIKLQNKQANDTLVELEAKAKESELKQVEFNKQLELANESSIKTINTYHTELGNVRLSKPLTGRSSCIYTKSGDSQTSSSNRLREVPGNVQCQLSGTFERFLKEESWRADQLRVGLTTCINFVNNLPNLKKEEPHAINP